MSTPRVDIPARDLLLDNLETNLQNNLLAMELGYANNIANLLYRTEGNHFIKFPSLYIVNNDSIFSDIKLAISNNRLVLKVYNDPLNNQVIFRPVAANDNKILFIGFYEKGDVFTILKTSISSDGIWSDIEEVSAIGVSHEELVNAINNEASQRIEGDNYLLQLINQETERAENSENSITQNLNIEIDARQAADADLQRQINEHAITVDSELSLISENPVQNKIITEALEGKQDNLTEMTDSEVDEIVNSLVM